MNYYNHTQKGYLMYFILFFLAIYFGFILFFVEFNFYILMFSILILGIIASFSSLNVKIDNKYLKIKFGFGIFRKKIYLKNIANVKTVKNRWYYGWGIRYIFWPHKTWIFNISGFDAIEIKTKNNKFYRIGSDDVEKLQRILLNHI